MPDREKVLEGLRLAAEELARYAPMKVNGRCQMYFDGAIHLLKEQEPVTMKPYYFNYVCSGCGSEIDGEFIDYTGGKIKFCPYCGKAVKLE